MSVQAGLRLIAGAISWQQDPSHGDIVAVKKPRGWDTSNQGGMVYLCLEQWYPGQVSGAGALRWRTQR